jgi:CRP/FNR family cyclic AMP-dependent transcriptional regulator
MIQIIGCFHARFDFCTQMVDQSIAIYISSPGDKSHAIRGLSSLGLPAITMNHLVISPEIILSYAGREITLEDGDTAFREGETANHYYQISEGSIKMLSVSPDGKEFIQGIFKPGDSFGEPPLICDFPYPGSAIALGDCRLLKLPKEKFMLLLRENFEVHLGLSQVLCQRLRYKSMVLSEISSYDPEHRIASLLKYLKSEYIPLRNPAQRLFRASDKYLVPFTRQQLADMSGLRVETVIRTVKKMSRDGKLKLKGRKIEV